MQDSSGAKYRSQFNYTISKVYLLCWTSQVFMPYSVWNVFLNYLYINTPISFIYVNRRIFKRQHKATPTPNFQLPPVWVGGCWTAKHQHFYIYECGVVKPSTTTTTTTANQADFIAFVSPSPSSGSHKRH